MAALKLDLSFIGLFGAAVSSTSVHGNSEIVGGPGVADQRTNRPIRSQNFQFESGFMVAPKKAEVTQCDVNKMKLE